MDKIIEDMASNELLAASEANMVAFWSAYGGAQGGTLYQTPEVVWFYTGIPEPLFNGVVCAMLTPKGVKATVESLQAKIDEQGAPAFWWVGPQAKPGNLGALLVNHGLQLVGETPGMAVDLARVEDAPEAVASFTMRKVVGPEMHRLWAKIAGVGTEFPPAAVEAMARVQAALAESENPDRRYYIGYLRDTPVATAALILEAGVAGIYAVATVPEARRQGIGRLMTVRSLLEARQIGYHIGILQASPMGYPLYQKIGFADICEYRLYLQSPQEVS